MKDSIDNLISITLATDNKELIKTLNVILIRPYIIHNLHDSLIQSKDHGIFIYGEKCTLEKRMDEKKSYLLGKNKITDHDLFNIGLPESFNDAYLLIEYYKEDDLDKSDIQRAKDTHSQLLDVFKGAPISVSVASLPASQNDSYNTHSSSYYVILRQGADNKGMKLQRVCIQRM